MNIIHLEDDKALCETFMEQARAWDSNTTITQFEVGKELLDSAKGHQEQIDIFVLDIRVKGLLDGVDVARELRTMGWKGPIIIASAYGKPTNSRIGTLNVVWVAKPWKMEAFFTKIQELVRQHNSP